MSEEKQPKKSKPSEDDRTEHSDEEPRTELSPDDAEDKCLLPVPPATGAEVLPEASGSGAQSSRASEGLTSLFKKISPFKSKESSRARKPPCKKLKKGGSFAKAKSAFRKTFRRSEPIMKGNDPEIEERRRRKYSDPTHLRTKIELETENEQAAESELKSKKSLFGYFSGSSSTGTKEKTKEAKAKEPKAKKVPKEEKEPKEKKESKPKKGFFGHSSASTSKTIASSETQKKALSPRTSDQPSIGGVSVGFFNEDLLPSESSGNPTEMTSLDIKSGCSFSPDAIRSRRPTITKRSRSTKETDEESSSD